MAVYFSGPVSYYVLKPTTYDLPPILLLGDRHEVETGDGDLERCPINKVGSHNVDTLEFINGLVDFIPADLPFPLDVYVEDYVVSGTPIYTQSPLDRYRQLLESQGMVTNKRVRWHRTDARGYLTSGYSLPNIEPEIFKSVDIDTECLASNDDIDPDVDIKKKIDTLKGIQEVTLDFANEVARLVVRRLYRDDRSNILRQAGASVISPFGSYDFLVETLSTLIMETFTERRGKRENTPGISVNEAISNWLLEIYTVLRIVKMPLAGFLSGLCLCYHGAVHTRNIVRIFQISGKYTTEYSHHVQDFLAPLPDKGRCLSAEGVMPKLKELTKERCDHLTNTLIDYAITTLRWFGRYPAVVNDSFWKTLSEQKSFDVAEFFRRLKGQNYPANPMVAYSILKSLKNKMNTKGVKYELLSLCQNRVTTDPWWSVICEYTLDSSYMENLQARIANTLEEEKSKEKYQCGRCARKRYK